MQAKTVRSFGIILLAAVAGAVIALARSGVIALPAQLDWIRTPVWRTEFLDTLRRVGPAFASYLVMSLYWTATAHQEAHAKAPEKGASRLIHQVLMNAAMLITVLPIPYLNQRFYADRPTPIIAGAVIAAIGALFAIWARRTLGRNWSSAVRLAEDHQLVRTGPYRLVRHPIYTGILAIFLGMAIGSGELHAWIGFLMVCVAYWRKIGLEERLLHDAFGEAFEDYRRKSKVVVPFLL
jgi:protein-S-isoprenylcysteine O-methyltransferase Ste14